MKIGVLTFHQCINYGSYWQTRCLVEGIRRRGHTVLIVNHQSKKINIAEWKCALQPVLPTPVPRTDYALYRQKIEKFFASFAAFPLSAPFQLEDPAQMEEFDIVVVGSDEVWNFSHPWYGYYPIFFGEGIHANRLISYAASFGNYDASFQLDQQWINKLLRFDKLSVRDENSKLIIKDMLGLEPEIVLDPCLQFPIKYPLGAKKSKRPFTAIYGHNFSAMFVQQINVWAIEKQIYLISIGYRNDWADEQWISADPLEFASFINESDSVITNFFHGCIFALINAKPFVCETSIYRNNKIEDLLTKVGAGNRLIKSSSTSDKYASLLAEPLDDEIFRNISIYQQSSDKWLDEALK